MNTQDRGVTLSIGLPVENGERFLERSLKSLLCCGIEGFELIISDNGSDDSTPEIYQAYGKIDWRIRFSRLATNHGAVRLTCDYWARNQ